MALVLGAPVKFKLRRDCSPEEEIVKQQELYFQVPRKKMCEMCKALVRLRKMKKKSEQSAILRIWKRIMKKARVPDVLTVIDLLMDMDRSELITHFGEASKNVFKLLFNSRDYSLYGKIMPVRDVSGLNAVRHERELFNKSLELSIQFDFRLDPGTDLPDDDEITPIPNIFNNTLADLKKPVISSNPWEVGFTEVYNPPVGLAKDPAPIYKSYGHEKFFAYVGEWERGKMNGDGRYQYLDGCVYVGKFKDNWPDGRGMITYKMGSQYNGHWIQGRFGTLPRDEEVVDDEDEENDKRYASSSLYTCVGSVYTGEFVHGRREGRGILKLPCGYSYDGHFLDGKPHGRGTITSNLTGYVFKGLFIAGEIEGIGTLITPKGDRIVKNWMKKHESDPPLTLTGVIKMYLQELLEAERAEIHKKNELFAMRKQIQLEHYVSSIRKEIHEERRIKKEKRKEEALAAKKEALKKLREARLKMLTGEDDDGSDSMDTSAQENAAINRMIDGM